MSRLSRREFLERTAGGAVALTFTGQTAPRTRMFISQNGAVAPRTSWPDAARLAARVGYGGIDWNLSAAREAGLAATQALFAEVKLIPTICSLPINAQVAFGDAAAFKASLADIEAAAGFAGSIGCRNMMLVLTPQSPQPRDDRRRLVVDRLGVIGEVLEKSGVRLGLEFLGPLCMRSETGCGPAGGGRAGAAASPALPRIPFIWTLPETVSLGVDSGSNIGVVLDIWHWHHSGGTIADILATDASRIVHVHLSDARPMPAEDVRDNMRLMPGEGAIDVTAFLRALQKIGYTGGVAPEPLGRIPADMAPEDASRLGYDTTRAAMTRAGVI
jgi:sugar phosphate isomerase/epimerase